MRGRWLFIALGVSVAPALAEAQTKATGRVGILSSQSAPTVKTVTSVRGGTQIVRGAVGLASPASTIDFSELHLFAKTLITAQYGGLGAVFSDALYQDPQAGYFTSPALGNFKRGETAWVVPEFSILFQQAVGGAAFQFISNLGTSNFRALRNGVVVSEFTTTTDSDTRLWYGFSGVTFDEIQIEVGGGNHSMLLDNLQTSTATPEPATVVLLSTGLLSLAGAVGAGRKRSELP
jgi:hypothetical protein